METRWINMEEQAMQAMRRGFDILDTVLITASETDKMYMARNELRRAYSLLVQDVERIKGEQTKQALEERKEKMKEGANG